MKAERFSQAARIILSWSDEFAHDLRHSLIEPEHILLALTKATKLEACSILEDEGITLEKLLPFIKSRMLENPPPANIDLSDAAKKVLELSVDTARQHGHYLISTAHLLIGLMRIKHQGVEDILAHFQVEAKEIIKAVEHYWEEHPEELEPRQPKRGREMSFIESLRITLGLDKKKNDEL